MEIIGEPLRYHQIAEGAELVKRVQQLMDIVGLNVRHLRRYPHAFSGGQRQRIGIARSLAADPSLIVCDEAVSALDVSIQAQVLNLLEDLKTEYDLSYLFIAHDLSVIEHISDRVAVMYVGKTVEFAETEELYFNPLHPYTEALLAAIPRTDPKTKKKRLILPGEVANPADPPPGCPFHPRCQYAQSVCKEEVPSWDEVSEGHFVKCHYGRDLSLRGINDTVRA